MIYVNNKNLNIYRKFLAPLLSESNGNVSFTSLRGSYICCAVESLLIFGISVNDVAISPESLSIYFTKTSKNLSPLSLVPSAANLYKWLNNSSSFRSLVICFATAPVTIRVIFVRPHRYLFTILNSENMFLNSLAAWSAVLKGTQPKPEKSSSAFTTFWFVFAVAELAPISVDFLYHWAASTYSLCCEVSLCQLISFSPLCAILRSLPHAVHNAETSHFWEFWMRIFYTTNRWILHNISCSLTELAVNYPPSILNSFPCYRL